MNQHLSPEQVAKWTAGERSASDEQHVRHCSECAAELARLEGALSLFRGAVNEWSEQQPEPKMNVAWWRTASWKVAPGALQPMRWAAACVALLVLATIPVFHNARERQRKAEMARADAALMEQVDAEISRSVPATMQPLAELMSLDSSGDQQSKQKEGNQ